MKDILMSPSLNQFARTPGALHASLLSADRGTLSSSDGIPAHTAERVAAALSSMQAASRHASALCSAEGSSSQQTCIQFEDKCLHLFTVGSHTYIAVAVTRDADMGLITDNTAAGVLDGGPSRDVGAHVRPGPLGIRNSHQCRPKEIAYHSNSYGTIPRGQS
ncbi:roadblock/LC7 domain-containing protein [Streptomyces sp. NPDC021218]|uniref:roadblock/LC7 domain-containing protein n=1 Tax=Streptomyces sp. NPDC021218 TaxID=3365119 RepID=UPI0037AE3D27